MDTALSIASRFLLELDDQEFRVLGLALCGKPLEGKNKADALALNARLMKLRSNITGVLHTNAMQASNLAQRLHEEHEAAREQGREANHNLNLRQAERAA